MGNLYTITPFTTVSVDTTLTDVNSVIEVDVAGKTITLTEPSASLKGKEFTIINESGGDIYADVDGTSTTIDGVDGTVTISEGYRMRVICNGLKGYLTIFNIINTTSMSSDYYLEVAKGNIEGHSIIAALGERESMGTTVTGEDIWRGTATTIPTPASGGEQMTVVSDDNADNGASATGVLTVGSNGVAEGEIIIYKKGAASTIYNMIAEGGNKSLVPHRMVPADKTLILKAWHCEEAQGKRVAFRIRSTDMHGSLIEGVFCFKGTSYIKQGETGELQLNTTIPALSIVKVSGWPDQSGGEGSCGWWGVLVDD